MTYLIDPAASPLMTHKSDKRWQKVLSRDWLRVKAGPPDAEGAGSLMSGYAGC